MTTSLHTMYEFLKTFLPGKIRTRDHLFCTWTRWPQFHAVRAIFLPTSNLPDVNFKCSTCYYKDNIQCISIVSNVQDVVWSQVQCERFNLLYNAFRSQFESHQECILLWVDLHDSTTHYVHSGWPDAFVKNHPICSPSQYLKINT
jgi:hypothetical protein